MVNFTPYFAYNSNRGGNLRTLELMENAMAIDWVRTKQMNYNNITVF